MGKNTEKLSRIIEYVGTFDISQIIANFKKMEQSLEKRHSSKSDILGLDNEVDKLKGIDKVLQKAISKGFKSPKSFSDFERSTNIMTTAIDKLNNEFKKVDKESLAQMLKRAESSAKTLNREVSTLEEKLQKNMQTLLKGADGAENITKAINENIKKVKEEKTALNNVNRLIQQSLDKQTEKVNKTKEEIKVAEQLKETYEAQKKAVQDLSNVNIFEGEARNGLNKNFKRSFLNKGNYSVINGGTVTDENLSSATQAISKILNDKQIPTIEKTKKAFTGLGLELNGIENKINLLVSAWQIYQNKVTSATDGIKAQNDKLKELNSTLGEQKTIQSNLTTALSSSRGNISSNYSTLINTISNSNVAQGKVRDIQNLQNVELPGLENNRKALQRLDDTLAENAEKTKATINSQKELDSTFDQLGSRLKYIFSFMNMYYVALRQIRQTFNDIQKIDKAFAEIAMVTDKTIDDMWGQYDDYAKIANELGQTTESVIKSSALYYQQGLSAAEALTLTKDTMKLATLANIDFKESTKLMTAALRSFHMEMEEGSHVTDVYSELAAHAAANVQDIAYAMSKTSSIAASAGMKFENLSAMLTTMIESTQEAPENLGTAMKSVVARFTEVKKDVSNLDSDIDLEGFDINKVDTALKSVGIQLKDEIGQIRDLDDVFLELSEKWNTLDRNTQRYIATIAAGSRQQSRFIALMENYERTMELVEVANNSAGRSSKQFEKYADSLTNKVNKLKNTWEQFRLNLVKSDFTKDAVDFLNNFINTFSKIGVKQLGTIILFGATIGKNLITGLLSGIQNATNVVGTTIGNLYTKATAGLNLTDLRLNVANLEKDKNKAELIIQELKNEAELTKNKIMNMQLPINSEALNGTIINISNSFSKWSQELNITEEEIRECANVEQLLREKTSQTNYVLDETSQDYKELIEQLQRYKQKLKQVEEETKNAKQTQNDYNNSLSQLKKGQFFQGLGSALSTGITTAITGAIAGQDWTQIFTSSAITTGISALNQLLSGNFYGAIATAAVAGVSAGFALLSNYLEKQHEEWKLVNNEVYKLEKTIEKIDKLQDEYNEKLDEANQEYEKERSRWEEVEKANKTYKKLKDYINLSEEEQQELNSATKTLIELCPELEISYDAQGNALLNIIKNYDEIIARQKESMRLAEAEANEAEINANTVQVLSLKTRLKKNEELKKQYQELNNLYLKESEIDYLTNNTWYNDVGSPLTLFALKTGKDYSLSLQDFLSHEEYHNLGANTGNYLYNFAEKSTAFKKLVLDTANDFYGETYTEVGDVIGKITEGNNQEGWKSFREKLIENYKDLYGIEELEKETKELQEEYDKAMETATGDILTHYIETKGALESGLDKIEPEHQNMVLETIMNNLDTDDFKKKYEQYINEYEEAIEEDNEESARKISKDISDLTEGFFKDNKGAIDEIIQGYTNVTQTQWEKIQTFQEGLANRTKEQNKQLLEELKQLGVAYDILKQLEQQMKDSEEKSKQISLKIGLYNAELGGYIKTQKIPLNVAENIGDQLDKREDFTDKRRYANYIYQKLEKNPKLLNNPEALNTIITFDYEGINAINKTSRFNSLKEALMDAGLEEPVAEAIVNDIDINRKLIFNVSTDIEDINDANSFLDSYDKVMENIRTNAGEINNILYSRGKDYDGSMFVSLETYEKMVKQWNKVADPGKELADGAISFDYNKYFKYDEDTGRMIIEDVKATQEAWEKAAGSISPITDKYIELKNLGDKRNTIEEELFQLLEKKYPTLKIYEDFFNMQAKNAQEANNEYKEIGNTIDSLISDYSTLKNELRDEGFISADTKSKIINDIDDINKQLIDSANSDKQLDWKKMLNPNSFKSALIKLIDELKSSAKDEDQKLAIIFQGYIDKINEVDLEDAKKEWEKYAKAAEDAAEAVKKAKEEQEEFVKSMGSLVSNYKSAASEMIKNGKITSSTYSTLAEDLKKINERYNLNLKIGDYVDESGGFNWIKYEADITTFIQKLKEEGVEADYLTQVLNDLKDAHKELDKELEDTTEEYKKSLEEVEEKTKSVKEANKSLSDAYKDLAEKEKKVTEAQEALNEALYGTGNKRKSTLDGMYNYEQALDVIDSKIESVKNNLEHIQPGDNIASLVSEYGQSIHSKKVNLEAQKGIYERSLSTIMGTLSPYSAYFTEQNGRLLADVAALNSASMNDKIKDEIENQIQMYNNSAKKISDIEKQIKQVEQDYLDFKKAYRDKYIALQEKVISTLKEEAQKELNTQKEKYSAMEEADNEYTEALEKAIQKQRDLRTQADEWEDLATKEKKLSLLERDTSGANAKEILKQQDDIEKARQNLLDKGIDNIIKGLKDLYNDQKKTRDAEIKYQEAVLNNATFIEEANAVINSWQTADDLISWFMEHGTEVQNMTNEQLDKYAEELEQLYNDREIYMNTSIKDFTNMLNIQEDEINDAILNTAEHLTFESSRSLAIVMEEVDKAIEKAREDIQSALDDVEEAKNKIVEAIENVAKAVEELETANKNAAEAAEKLARVQEQANKASIESGNNSGNSSNFLSSNQPLEKSRVQQLYEAAINSPGSNEVHFNDNSGISDSEVAELAGKLGKYVGFLNNKYYYASSKEELEKIMFGGSRITGGYATPNGTFVYEKGGLVDYTGPAWVDGTPAQPEAFLSAKDTQMISNFTDVLRSLYASIGSSNSQQVNPSIGDTHIEVHINIENVASDYDVDSAVERVKQDIIDAANQTGRNVILYQ